MAAVWELEARVGTDGRVPDRGRCDALHRRPGCHGDRLETPSATESSAAPRNEATRADQPRRSAVYHLLSAQAGAQTAGYSQSRYVFLPFNKTPSKVAHAISATRAE